GDYARKSRSRGADSQRQLLTRCFRLVHLAPRESRKQCGPRSEYVAALIDLIPTTPRLLGCRVAGSSHERARSSRTGALTKPGDAEIENLQLSGGSDEQILGLDVAM